MVPPEDQGRKTVEKRRKKAKYTMYIQGQNKTPNSVIHHIMEEGMRKQHFYLRSLIAVKDDKWSVNLTLGCPIELQRAAEIFSDEGLWVSYHRLPPPQLVVYSRYPATNEKIASGFCNVLHEAGYTNEELAGVVLKSIRCRREWHTWTARVPELTERVLLDKDRFVAGMQTFYVRRFLTVPQCGRCLRFGHESCKEKIRCFKCGSPDHKIRDCKTQVEMCIPCK